MNYEIFFVFTKNEFTVNTAILLQLVLSVTTSTVSFVWSGNSNAPRSLQYDHSLIGNSFIFSFFFFLIFCSWKKWSVFLRVQRSTHLLLATYVLSSEMENERELFVNQTKKTVGNALYLLPCEINGVDIFSIEYRDWVTTCCDRAYRGMFMDSRKI